MKVVELGDSRLTAKSSQTELFLQVTGAYWRTGISYPKELEISNQKIGRFL